MQKDLTITVKVAMIDLLIALLAFHYRLQLENPRHCIGEVASLLPELDVLSCRVNPEPYKGWCLKVPGHRAQV